MDSLPATWTALCALVFLLGARHGFDADHLATIDGLTRYNARVNPRLARFAGALSRSDTASSWLVALAAGSLSAGWQTPAWLESHRRRGLGVLPVRARVPQRARGADDGAGRGRRAGRLQGPLARPLPDRAPRAGRSLPWACCLRCRSTRSARRRCSRSPPAASAAWRRAVRRRTVPRSACCVVDGVNGALDLPAHPPRRPARPSSPRA